MKKTQRIIALALLITVLSILTPPTPISAAELPSKMPVVYVDPQSAYAAKGTTFNVSIKIFNLTDSFYGSNEEWQPGESFPSPGSRYNYSLGNMYGFNISFSWNPEILAYRSRSVHTPVEDYPDGVLHGPIWAVQEDINSTAGTYSIVQNSGFFVEGFNCPNRSATVFTITFKVKKEGVCSLRLENVELIPDPLLVVYNGIRGIIPHQTLDGVFTVVEMPRITSMDIGVLVGSQLANPLISGENATVRILITNKGATTDSYNLTLYFGTTPLETWTDEDLGLDEEKTYNYTLKTVDLVIGIHKLMAKATILHNETKVIDSLTANFTVITTPLLSISSSPKVIYKNDTATLKAEASFQDPNGKILNYRWLFYKPGTIFPAYEFEGMSVTHAFAENGTWRVVLVVRDNWGVTYDPRRNATAPYSDEILLQVHTGVKPPPDGFVYEQIAVLIVILTLLAVISILIYVARRRHR